MKVFEIGVGPAETCRAAMIENATSFYLFEPDIHSFRGLDVLFRDKANWHVFNVAVGCETKLTQLYQKSGSSFIAGTRAPEVCHNPRAEQVLQPRSVTVVAMRDIDPGDIDVLLLDTEGGEYPVLRDMVSRPKEIVIEMHSFGSNYTNPHYNEILEWCSAAGYELTATSDNGEDYTFTRAATT